MWDKEADVVIVGCGGAGATAAIAARDAGAEVIILEKHSQGGGNTRLAGGTLREFLDVESAATYMEAVCLGTVNRDVVQSFVEEGIKNPDWVKELGGELEHFAVEGFPPAPNVIFPHLPGADGVGGRYQLKGVGKMGGINLWSFLQQKVEDRRVEVLFNTAARRLKKNESSHIIGVQANAPGGEIMIKARRAVILACGGFGHNPHMQLQHLGLKFCDQGHPGNTGDGIRMAQEVGADLWHMSAVACTLGYKVPEHEPPIQAKMPAPGYVIVDQNGKRFMNEAGTDMHAMALMVCHLDFATVTYPRIPAYVIFDENTRLAGPVARTVYGRITEFYQWSENNMAEIEKEWIQAGDSIADLAPYVGVRPEALQETVARYNTSCAGGYDPEFNRQQDTLVTIASPPFYVIAVWPALLNTQGGPIRNSRAQVIDSFGNPIQRLYSAGELGSLFGSLYPGAGNITESLAFGRIAGRNAAAEEPW